MDNITHTFAGLLVAEGAFRLHRRRSGGEGSSSRGALYATSLIANNLPDLDFLYSGITGGKLGYLLHHRGHTHTVAAILPMALLTLGVVGGGARWRGRVIRREEWALLAIVSAIGLLLHLVMDWTNNYGIHPFWPVYDGWVYGDAVFIVEPLLWVSAVPPLLFTLRARISRLVLASLLVLILGLSWATAFVPLALAAFVTALAGVTFWLSARLDADGRAALGIGGWIFWTALFIGASRLARADASRVVRDDFPAAALHDAIVTPMPANPLCWSLIAVRTEGERYVLDSGTLALVPSLLAASDCPRMTWTENGTTAPLQPMGTRRPEIRWVGRFEAPRDELVALNREDCRVAAFLRFSRAPFWLREGEALIVGDLRYDRREALDFAELRLPATIEACPEHVPPWIPPRKDILR